jgi:hypothetical protein
VPRRTLQLEAGNGPAERKGWAMSTQGIGAKGRIRPAAVGIVLASAIAVSALTAEARSIWSGSAKASRPAAVQMDPYASKGGWIDSHSHTAFHRQSLRELEAKKSGR